MRTYTYASFFRHSQDKTGRQQFCYELLWYLQTATFRQIRQFRRIGSFRQIRRFRATLLSSSFVQMVAFGEILPNSSISSNLPLSSNTPLSWFPFLELIPPNDRLLLNFSKFVNLFEIVDFDAFVVPFD